MKYLLMVMLTLFSNTLLAQAADHAHHAAHTSHLGEAPAGIMGDHVHSAGNWMFSYSYNRMHMDGMRDGGDNVSTAKVLSDYMVAPLRMDMEMHMFGAMYSVTDRFSLMGMVPFVRKEMDHVTRMGARFTTRSDGVGDISLRGIYALSVTPQQSLLLTLGLSAPTGDIDATDDTPTATNARLPYPMQLGSGTWDLIPGITWSRKSGDWSQGIQALATVRLGDNNNDYTLGDRLEISGWASWRFLPQLKGSLRVKAQSWDKIDGNDQKLNPMMIPTADPELQGGTRVDLLVGMNFYIPNGNRLAIEVGLPVYEDLDDLQMSTDWQLSTNWQLAF